MTVVQFGGECNMGYLAVTFPPFNRTNDIIKLLITTCTNKCPQCEVQG